MTSIQLFPMDCEGHLADSLIRFSKKPKGEILHRRFPDEESYIRVPQPPECEEAAIICSLDHPDPKFLPLIFAASALRDRGANRVGLVAPYLCYLRQDRRFQAGEAIAARLFAEQVSAHFDWLVTVEPHLHRIRDLREVFAIPAYAVSAAVPVAAWIKANVDSPLIVGPDEESLPWIRAIAAELGAPFRVLSKVRRGDELVTIDDGDSTLPAGLRPVIIDDVTSSGATLLAAMDLLGTRVSEDPICIVIHALTGRGSERSPDSRLGSLVSTNSVAHPSNAIDISDVLWRGISTAIEAGPNS